MKILQDLTIKNLKLNKKRTIVTIIGVILSVALICAVAGMITSMQGSLINYAIETDGNRHITVENVEENDLKYFLNNPHVEKLYLTESLGYARVDDFNKNKPYGYVVGYTSDALLNSPIKLISGRLPENSGEIVISLPYQSGSDVVLGDTITLDVGNRVCADGTKLYQENPYNVNEDGTVVCDETLVNITSRSYKVVGIMERPSYSIEDYSAPGYTMITYVDEVKDNANVSLLFKDASYYEEYVMMLSNDSTLNKYTVTYNDSLLRWSLASTSDSTMNMLYTVAGVVICIIIFTSVFVIKNSFDISTQEKSKMMGMLKSVGATSRQIKKSVLFEGFIIGLIGIPLGILSGILADYILVQVINTFGNLIFEDLKFIFYISYEPIILSIVLGFVTIYLSCLRSAKKASRVSAIEAIRNNNEIKIDKKKIKNKRIVDKLFGIGGTIAYKNLRRTKKRNRTTVISILVSVATFIALSTFINYGFKLTSVYYEDINYDLSVIIDRETNEEFEYIANLDLVDYANLVKYKYIEVNLKDYLNEEMLTYMSGEETLYARFIAITDEELEKIFKENNIKTTDFSYKALLIDNFMLPITDTSYKEIDILDLKKGKTIRATYEDDMIINFDIIKRIDKLPMGVSSNMYSTSPTFIISNSYFDTLFSDYSSQLYLKSSKSDELEKNINNYLMGKRGVKSYQVYNVADNAKAEKQFVLIISIFLYGFIIVISLIGITNIINTINTNMNLRRRELAMLKSIGMTKHEFNKMIRLESIMYSFKSLVIGIPLGVILSYFIYMAFASGNDYGFIFPIKPILISIVVVFFLVNVIMNLSLRKMKDENIIEVIKKENI